MTHQELEDAIPLYVIGALERGERQALDAHLLSGCTSCHSALREFQGVATALPFSVDLLSPPRLVRAAIMSAPTPKADHDTMGRLSDVPRLGPGKWMDHLLWPETPSTTMAVRVIAGLIVAAAGIAGGFYVAQTASNSNVTEEAAAAAQWQVQAAASQVTALQQQLDEREQLLDHARQELRSRLADIADLKGQLIQREAELDVLKAQLGRIGKHQALAPEDELATLLRDSTAHVVALAGTETATRASGILFYDHRIRKIWLYALNLPECPSGKEYRLWALYESEKAVSIGSFRVGKGETSHLFVKSLSAVLGAKTFFVSLEPTGGDTPPTGVSYLQSRA